MPLGPRSPLRRAVSQAARQKASVAELASGYSVTALGEVARAARKAARALARAWAACIKRVFEVDPVLCAKCGGSMALAAIILDDGELDRILGNQGWPVDFPRTKPARSPPDRDTQDEVCQVDPSTEQWDGQDRPDNDWPA